MKKSSVLLLASTPLHLLDALILATTTFQDNETIIVLLDQKDARYHDALQSYRQAHPATFPFDACYLLGLKPKKLWAKLRNKRQNHRLLAEIIARHKPHLIITGNDRKIEFDYAMDLASRERSNVTGGYMDDGLHSYIPQNLAWYQYTLFDTLLQRLFLGRKHAIPRLLGTSASVKTCYFYRPDLAHEALHRKQLEPLDAAALRRLPLHEILRNLSETLTKEAIPSRPDATLLILPHPSVKREIPGYQTIIDTLFALPNPLLLKCHPRDAESPEAKRCRNDAKCHLLPADVAMELLIFNITLRTVCGMRSSALLTLSWLLPDTTFYNLRTGDETYDRLFARFGIETIDPKECV